MFRSQHFRLRAGLGLTLITALLAGGSVVALAADGLSTAKLFASSYVEEAKGDPARALANVLQVLEHDHDHYLANLRAGWLSYQNGEQDDAAVFYRKACALAPNAIEPRLGLMLPLMAAERWPEAEAAGKVLLDIDPRNYLGRSRLAWVHYVRAHYALAEALYRDVLADYPSETDMMVGLAWTWSKQGRHREAADMFARVLDVRPDHASAQAGLAGVQVGMR